VRALFLAAALVVPVAGAAAEGSTSAAERETAQIDALAAASDTIVLGVCTRASARWDAQSRLVVTDATIAVREVVRGRSARTLTLTEPGGALPARNLGMVVPDGARFAAGEESLLFLAHDGAGRLRVVGGRRGQHRVERDAATGAVRAGARPWPELRERLRAQAPTMDGR
jgi:hypothetical protein